MMVSTSSTALMPEPRATLVPGQGCENWALGLGCQSRYAAKAGRPSDGTSFRDAGADLELSYPLWQDPKRDSELPLAIQSVC